MELTGDEVKHIALLARIGMTEDEIEKMRSEMSHIMENFAVLNSVDTSGVPPTGRSVDLVSVMRDDETGDRLSRDDVLTNAPSTEGGFIRVRAVLE
jgi:aspartyl-tRNA(Asn)/glutamyl-tRNA(Gln) amidotransferase subunit C